MIEWSDGEVIKALAMAAEQSDPSSVSAATRLRACFSSEVAAAALQQESLRRKALPKLGHGARTLLFTRDGLEQATRPEVSRWRAQRLREAGVERVLDLGCGIGLDAAAMAAAGLQVVAVERDPETAAMARHNLARVTPAAEVITGDAVEVAHDLAATPGTAFFLDPSRRTRRGRTWRLEDFSPPWEFVAGLVTGTVPTVVKLGPGITRSLLPEVPTSHVSHAGDAVETTLWTGLPGLCRHEAVAIERDGHVHALAAETAPEVPLGPLGRWLHEPDPALSRAALVGLVADDLVQLDPGAGYYSSDAPVHSPFMTSFWVDEVLPATPKALKSWARGADIATLEIKKRGRGGLLEVDPAILRRRLDLRGTRAATLVLARCEGTIVALRVHRARPDGIGSLL